MQLAVVKREDDDLFVKGNAFLVEGNAYCFGWVLKIRKRSIGSHCQETNENIARIANAVQCHS